MIHEGRIDKIPHYNVIGETVRGVRVKEVHVPEDASKQTGGSRLRITP